MVESNVGVHCS